MWDISTLPEWPSFPIGEPQGVFPSPNAPSPYQTPPRPSGPLPPRIPSYMPPWGPLHPSHPKYQAGGPTGQPAPIPRGPLLPIPTPPRDPPIPASWAVPLKPLTGPTDPPPSDDMVLDSQSGRYQCPAPGCRATPFDSRQKVLAHIGRVHSLGLTSISNAALLSLGVWACLRCNRIISCAKLAREPYAE